MWMLTVNTSISIYNPYNDRGLVQSKDWGRGVITQKGEIKLIIMNYRRNGLGTGKGGTARVEEG